MAEKTYPAQSYCGCCGREIASGFFCADCGSHLLGSNLPPEERTFFAQHGTPCPLAAVVMDCPECGAQQQEDLDGFGVVHCPACGYCSHPSRNSDICGICGKRILPCQECHGRGFSEGHAGLDRGAECGACEGRGVIVEEVS